MRASLDVLARRVRLSLSPALARLGRHEQDLDDLRLWRARLRRVCLVAEGVVSRADLSPVALFRLPADCEIHLVSVWSPAGSDAAMSAAIDVGTEASPTLLLAALDVRGNAGAGQLLPRAVRRHGPVGPDPVDVVGRYAETGAASTAGGPWSVSVFYSVE